MVAIFLAPIYVLVNVYVLLRSMKWLKICHGFFHNQWFQRIFCGVYVLVSTSILTAFFLPVSRFQRVVKLISNYWLGTFMYILLFIAIADLFLIFLKQVRKKYHLIIDRRKILACTGGVVFFLVGGMSIYGIYHANQIKVNEYQVTIEKHAGNIKEMNVLLVADLHLGYNVGTRMMSQMVDKINKEKPDLVCFAGDIFDNEYEALGNPKGIIKLLKGIKSTYGVYAVFGNHDIQEPILAGFTFGSKNEKVNDPRMISLLEDANITLLQDKVVMVENSFYLVGRRDYERPGDGTDYRVKPSELLKDLDSTKPIIVMDHQPRELEELARGGADLDLSGHTHAGQVFPANITVKFMWDNPWGYKKVDQLHSFVTSGIGVFGPNMRTFTESEIMKIQVKFK